MEHIFLHREIGQKY